MRKFFMGKDMKKDMNRLILYKLHKISISLRLIPSSTGLFNRQLSAQKLTNEGKKLKIFFYFRLILLKRIFWGKK